LKAVIQRVKSAEVSVQDQITGKIGEGLLILLGISDSDTEDDLSYMVRKITNMRIFEDKNEKMNLSVTDVSGSLLVVSQFTLFADTRRGNRPSFTDAGAPDFSRDMYEKFILRCRDLGIPTEHGLFGAHMLIDMTADGPVTIMLDSAAAH